MLPRAVLAFHGGLTVCAKPGLELADDGNVAFVQSLDRVLCHRMLFCSNAMPCQTPTIRQSRAGQGNRKHPTTWTWLRTSQNCILSRVRNMPEAVGAIGVAKPGTPWVRVPGGRTTVEERTCRMVQNGENAGIRRRLTAGPERNSRIFRLTFGSSA